MVVVVVHTVKHLRKQVLQVHLYGFNGQEKSPEIADGHTTALYWEYDSRIGRRWNVDPVEFAYLGPYATFDNNPIYFNDVQGLTADPPVGQEQKDGTVHTDSKGSWTYEKASNKWKGKDGIADISNEKDKYWHEYVSSVFKAVGEVVGIEDQAFSGSQDRYAPEWVAKAAELAMRNVVKIPRKPEIEGHALSDTENLEDLPVLEKYKGVSQAGWVTKFNVKKGVILVEGKPANIKADFIIDQNGKLKLGAGHFKLSDMADNVKGAGTVMITNGKIDYIDNNSGHYVPLASQMYKVIQALGNNGIVVPAKDLQFIDVNKRP